MHNDDCNFNCRIRTEPLLRVTDSHAHCKSANISETVEVTATSVGLLETTDSSKVLPTTPHQIVSFPMILRDFKGHAFLAGVFKCNFFVQLICTTLTYQYNIWL